MKRYSVSFFGLDGQVNVLHESYTLPLLPKSKGDPAYTFVSTKTGIESGANNMI